MWIFQLSYLWREKGQCMKLKMKPDVFSKVLKFLVTGLLFLLFFCSFYSITAKADELYFDEDGNLYFSTRDKKAAGSVRYLTIGWIIKRYDMPLDAPGQQYVIVTKKQYKPNEPDPDDSRYVWSYFWSDKDEILNAVKSVSQEWYNILTGYGDDVYIDSVMTVVESGKELGTLSVGGQYTGEVYFDYEGIAGARGWASPESLKAYYDMKVEFPQIVKKTERHVEVIKREEVAFNSSQYMSFILGDGSYGNEAYNITDGIPSGKTLYVKGIASSTQAVLKLTKVTAQLTECIEVPVVYLLRWQDYYGKNQNTTRTIYRYYEVTREFTYYEAGGMEIYDLSSIYIEGDVFENGGYTESIKSAGSSMKYGSVVYGDVEAHIDHYDMKTTNTIGTIILTGENGMRPLIPDADYSEIAESFLGDVYVKNDKVTIDGATVLSDEVCLKNGEEPKVVLHASTVNVYCQNLGIAKDTPNGQYDDCYVELTYKNADEDILTEDYELGDVTVHTPVYCSATSYTDKSLNQAVCPSAYDVVLGEYMTIAFNDFGMHRAIKGYGLGSYTGYVGARQVCCPFKVEYNGVVYEADTWITVEEYNVKLRVMEDNGEGDYTIYVRNMAYNGLTDMDDKLTEENANLSIDSFGAWEAVGVRIIGKLHNLELEYMGNIYNAPQMPVDVTQAESELESESKEPSDEEENKANDTCRLSFETVGDIAEADTVEIKYSYYHEDENGVLTPVDVYGVSDRNYLDGVITGKYVESETFAWDSCEIAGNEDDKRLRWSTDICLYDELLVVPQGTTQEDIQAAVRENRMQDICHSAGSVIVCVDIVSYKAGVPYLSYINEENAKNGYCNMWLWEGGTQSYPYGAVIKIELGDYMYYDYEVSGTH